MAKRKKITWLGNKHKREFHRVVEGETHPAQCQLNEIAEEHRVIFGTAREAMTAEPGRKAYDSSAYCTRKFKSRK